MDAVDRDRFDREWREALVSGEARWQSFPADPPTTQTELFELVKARRVDQILAEHAAAARSVLEVGCGSAGMSIYLANRGFEACALDLSASALRVAALNAGRRGGPRLGLVLGDVLALPFRDGFFDVVMSYGLLEHFRQEEAGRLVREARRVLRPGGLFVADIVPGLGRLNSRTLGAAVSYAGGAAGRVVRGRVREAGRLWRDYFRPYYESTLDDRGWARVLAGLGLRSVCVEVCRPFPPLALAGRSERAYVKLMQRAMPLWQRFDGRTSWLVRRWGWMYLIYGICG